MLNMYELLLTLLIYFSLEDPSKPYNLNVIRPIHQTREIILIVK